MASHRRSWLALFVTLFSSFLVMIAIAAYGVDYSIQTYWRSSLRQEITRNLAEKAQMLASRVEADHTTPIAEIVAQDGLHSGARATVIDANGNVVADSQAPATSLENEGRLPEFTAALRGETGMETRARNGIPVAYVAVAIPGGAVRLAYPMADLEIAEQQSQRLLLLGCVIAAIAALVISALAASAVTHRQLSTR